MTVKNFMKMTTGCIILSFSVYFFEIPNNFSTGGVSGLGVILAKITPISAPVWIWGLNILLLIVGFAVLGNVSGAYTNDKKSMLHTVCGRFEAPKLRKKIKTIDPNAFIIITTSSEILGSGFMNL